MRRLCCKLFSQRSMAAFFTPPPPRSVNFPFLPVLKGLVRPPHLDVVPSFFRFFLPPCTTNPCKLFTPPPNLPKGFFIFPLCPKKPQFPSETLRTFGSWFPPPDLVADLCPHEIFFLIRQFRLYFPLFP